MSDKEINSAELSRLISLAKSKDQTAFSVLLETYQPLINSMARSFSDHNGMSYDYEDWKQEASVAFCDAVYSFDDDQHVEFGLYAKICVSNALKTIQRKMKLRMETVLLDDDFWKNFESKTGSGEDVEVEMIEAEKFRELFLTVRKNLSPYENNVWWAFFSGMRPSEIAKRAGTSEKSVSNAIYRIRVKLRQALGAKNE